MLPVNPGVGRPVAAGDLPGHGLDEAVGVTVGLLRRQPAPVTAAGPGHRGAEVDGHGERHAAGVVGVVADQHDPTGGVGLDDHACRSLSRRVDRVDRVEVHPAAELAGGDVAGDPGAAVERGDVGVEAGRGPVAAVEGALVDPQHVGHRVVEEAVEASEHVDQEAAQPVAPVVVERRQVGHRCLGSEQQLVGPHRGPRHPGPPAAGRRRHQSLARGVRHRAERGAVALQLGRGGAAPSRTRRSARGVRDGGADLGAPVLEHQHVGDRGVGAQGGRALGPQVDDLAGLRGAEVGEGGVVVGGVEHDLGPAVGEGRPPVGEGQHVVGAGGLEPARAERAAGRPGGGAGSGARARSRSSRRSTDRRGTRPVGVGALGFRAVHGARYRPSD